MVKIVEVNTPGCSHCAEFKKFYETEIAPKYKNIEIEFVSVMDPKGQELVSKHMIFASPGIIINDELFSTGGVDKKKFIEKITALGATA